MSTSRRLPWELIGAVIGAGLASGREVASFFAQYGPWSWCGIALAVCMLAYLADTPIPVTWQNHFPGRLWQTLQTLLLLSTGGTMLAGAGEVAALTLPIHHAYWLGIAFTLFLACFLARRTTSGLAWVSRILLLVLAVLIALGWTQPPMKAVSLRCTSVPAALLRGITYGGFNAALQAPIMALHRALPAAERKRSVRVACAALFVLLGLCNAVLLRHPALIGETMPFIRLTAQYGQFGYALGAVSLYLAILSTLTACLKGLENGILPVIGLCSMATLGFSGAVEVLYPLLGGGCMLMLLWAKFRNSPGSPFISRRSML